MAARRTPSTAWYWGAGLLALASTVAAVAWGWGSYQQLQDRLEALPRTAVPGAIVVDVEDAQPVTVFYEDPDADDRFVVQARGTSTLRDAPFSFTVTDDAGRSVATTPYGADLRFGSGERVTIAVATFDAPSAGAYTIEVAGDVPSGARVSAGTVLDAGLIASAVGTVALLVVSVLSAIVTAVVVAVGRSRAPLRPSSRERPRALV